MNRSEGIRTGVSTGAFFNDEEEYKDHMNQVAELGGGSPLFIKNKEHIPSQPRLASLVIERNLLQQQINTEWKNAAFDVTLVLSDGVLLNNAYPYNDIEPQIEDHTLKYRHIRLGNLISLRVSLREDVVNKKSTIISLSVSSRDKSFSPLLENYPISLNNQVSVEGETGFVIFGIKNYN